MHPLESGDRRFKAVHENIVSHVKANQNAPTVALSSRNVRVRITRGGAHFRQG